MRSILEIRDLRVFGGSKINTDSPEQSLLENLYMNFSVSSQQGIVDSSILSANLKLAREGGWIIYFCPRCPYRDVIELSSLLAFVPAAIVITMAPGPDTTYVLTQSIKSGRLAGLGAGLGVASGILVHMTAAVLGLAALLRTSALAYTIVKYAGVLYLLYLGVQMFCNDEEFDLGTESLDGSHSPVQAYKKAVVVNISNPKVAVFVLAFFPQFIPAHANVPLQMSILGVLYAVLSLSYRSGVTLFAAQVRQRLLDSPLAQRTVQYVSGSVLIGFGVKLALEKRSTY